MKIVFMGTPEFAVPSLVKLTGEHDVVAVITSVDKPAGRGKKIRSSAVKKAAIELGIPVLQPTNLKNEDFIEELASFGADLFIVVAFRMLPETVWSLPPKGTINLHGSLLPQYRGAAPINRAIMNGETVTGLTTFFINENIDTGAVIDTAECEIGPNMNAGDLHDLMMEIGSDLLIRTVASIESGTAKSIPQKSNESMKSAPKLFKEDCRINWNNTAQNIHNHIRGLCPFPAAFSIVEGADFSQIKIFESRISDLPSNDQAGTIECSKSQLLVNTESYKLEILSLQAPGKQRMGVKDFLNGFKPNESLKFI